MIQNIIQIKIQIIQIFLSKNLFYILVYVNTFISAVNAQDTYSFKINYTLGEQFHINYQLQPQSMGPLKNCN